MSKIVTAFLLVAAIAQLPACGQKGPLFIPQDAAAQASTTLVDKASTDVDKKKKTTQ